MVMSMTAHQLKPSGRVIQLDFIRGIAILGVMKYHFRTVPVSNRFAASIDVLGHRLGWMGVDLFFVLSGFLVGGLIVQELLKSHDLRIRRFLVRRAFKIWPAYYVYLMFQVALHRHPWRTFVWQNFLNVQNYAGTSLNHTWSLAVEEHFYLLLPPLMLVCFRRYRKLLPLILAAICLVVLAGRVFTVYGLKLGDPQWQTQARIDSLLFGVLLSWMFYSRPETFQKISRKTAILAAVFASGMVIALQQGPHTPFMSSFGYTMNYLSLGSLFLILYKYRGRLSETWLYRGIAWIGLYSYGIYLWHIAITSPVAQATARVPASIQWGVLLCSQYVVATVMGVFMTKLVEAPMLKVRDRVFPRGQATMAPVDTLKSSGVA